MARLTFLGTARTEATPIYSRLPEALRPETA